MMYNITQECRKALKSGGAQRLDRVELYGKILFLWRNYKILGAKASLAPPVSMPVILLSKLNTSKILAFCHLHD